jgi:PAS domain-containing protein
MIERLATSLHQGLPLLADDLAGPLLELLLQRSTGGLAVADEQGHLLRVNPSLCRRLRRPEAELLGQPWGAALGVEVAAVAELPVVPPSNGSVVDLVRARREGTSLAIALPRPDGTLEPATLSLAPLRGEGGAIRRLLLLIPETVDAEAGGAQGRVCGSGGADGSERSLADRHRFSRYRRLRHPHPQRPGALFSHLPPQPWLRQRQLDALP